MMKYRSIIAHATDDPHLASFHHPHLTVSALVRADTESDRYVPVARSGRRWVPVVVERETGPGVIPLGPTTIALRHGLL